MRACQVKLNYCRTEFDSNRNFTVSFKIVKNKDESDPMNEKATPM